MSFSPKGALAAVKAFAEAVSSNVVAPEEVQRRISICTKGGNGKPCPRYKIIRSPASLSGLSRIMGRIANKHRVPKEVSNYRCQTCGCSMALLVPARGEELHQDTPEQAAQRPGYCWVPGAVEAAAPPEPAGEPRSF